MALTIEETATQFEALIDRVVAGEAITICRGADPVAVLRPIGVRTVWGDLEGGLGADFDEPLDDFEPPGLS